MSELDGGILICGYKLTDRYYRDVLEDIPSYFEMLLLASGRVIAEAPTSVLTVEMPMKVSDLVNTVDMMLSQIERRLKKEKKKPVGSEFYNTLACLVGDYFMKIGATLPPCDWKTKDAYANMDIAGYNYGLFRYKHDLKKYPKRLILRYRDFLQGCIQFLGNCQEE
mgnify:CR=1 FL=1